MIATLILVVLTTTPPLIDGEIPRPTFTPAPSTDQLAPTSSSGYTVESWESLIIIYFEPEDHQWARDIIDCESHGNPDAYNSDSGAAGLWQFIPSSWEFSKPWPEASPYNPTAAFMAARWLLDQEWGGRSQWACSAIKGY